MTWLFWGGGGEREETPIPFLFLVTFKPEHLHTVWILDIKDYLSSQEPYIWTPSPLKKFCLSTYYTPGSELSAGDIKTYQNPQTTITITISPCSQGIQSKGLQGTRFLWNIFCKGISLSSLEFLFLFVWRDLEPADLLTLKAQTKLICSNRPLLGHLAWTIVKLFNFAHFLPNDPHSKHWYI